MKIKKIRLNNFRIYQEETTIDFKDLTVFVGKNEGQSGFPNEYLEH